MTVARKGRPIRIGLGPGNAELETERDIERLRQVALLQETELQRLHERLLGAGAAHPEGVLERRVIGQAVRAAARRGSFQFGRGK